MAKEAHDSLWRELPSNRSQAFVFWEAVAQNHQARPG